VDKWIYRLILKVLHSSTLRGRVDKWTCYVSIDIFDANLGPSGPLARPEPK
jgi:hypothetical protein